MSLVENPYATPVIESPAATSPDTLMDPEEIRKKYLRHEAAVRSIGTLYYLGAGMMAFAGVFGLVDPDVADGETFAAALICLVLAVVGWLIGRSLRRLDPRVKSPVVLFAVLGLLAIPLGTLVNAYILYLMCSKKSKVVFSEEYKEVIPKTPHLKRRGLLSVLICAFLLVVLVVIPTALVVMTAVSSG